MSTDHERDQARLRQMQRLIDDCERRAISQDTLLQELDALLVAFEKVER